MSEDQPLYIDDGLDKIMCKWCPSWTGSISVKVVNQHVRKSKSHSHARLKRQPSSSTGVQLDISVFFIILELYYREVITFIFLSDTDSVGSTIAAGVPLGEVEFSWH